jgi:hypothetical protein
MVRTRKPNTKPIRFHLRNRLGNLICRLGWHLWTPFVGREGYWCLGCGRGLDGQN